MDFDGKEAILLKGWRSPSSLRRIAGNCESKNSRVDRGRKRHSRGRYGMVVAWGSQCRVRIISLAGDSITKILWSRKCGCHVAVYPGMSSERFQHHKLWCYSIFDLGMEKQLKMCKLRGQTVACNKPLRTIKLDARSELDIYVKYFCIANGPGYLYPHHLFVVFHDTFIKFRDSAITVACKNTWFSVREML